MQHKIISLHSVQPRKVEYLDIHCLEFPKGRLRRTLIELSQMNVRLGVNCMKSLQHCNGLHLFQK